MDWGAGWGGFGPFDPAQGERGASPLAPACSLRHPRILFPVTPAEAGVCAQVRDGPGWGVRFPPARE